MNVAFRKRHNHAASRPQTGATGDDGDATLGLFVGAASIQLMAWSFILAIRLRWLEPLFGGLDRMYRVHRWCGSIEVEDFDFRQGFGPDLSREVERALATVSKK